MPELTDDFQSLPEEYQQVVRLAQDKYNITITPLQVLVGGRSGAGVYLVSVSFNETKRVEHCILKLDRKGKSARSDEVTRHDAVMSKSTPEFSQAHIAELVFNRVEHEGVIAIFYRLAGQSLLKYRPLSNYERQSQLKTIFTKTNTVLMTEWNSGGKFQQAVSPQKLLEKWLGFRLDPGGNIERFLRETCQVDPQVSGFLINGHVFPNPFLLARKLESWGKARSMDVAAGFLHGDLNTNNILVKFSDDKASLEGYYLIDFALFKDDMPLLYDQRYLEMSYLMHAMSQISFGKYVGFLTLFAVADVPDPHKVPIETSGISAVIASARSAFAAWVTENHPSLHDDLWGQYWLAGVAAGLAYCHKAGLTDEQRLAGLIYAAASLKRYANIFNLPRPTEVDLLYEENQLGSNKPLRVSKQEGPKQGFPSGTVTFLFTDIEGSTRLSQSYPEAMPSLLARHNEILNQAITTHNGYIFETVGDSFLAAFHNASDGLEAALDIQRGLQREAWSPAPIKVRIGLHTGTAQLQNAPGSQRYDGYSTLAISQRIMSAGHGGQILLSRTTVDLVSDKLPASIGLKDMREHYLKDVSQPVHVYQLTAPGLPSEFPPLKTQEAVNHNLPVQLTPFIGRETELASLNALLSDAGNRLLTIVAPGGMGKTRLSLEAAGQMIPLFPQGIYFVALDRIPSAESIVQAVAEVLPISLSSNEDPKFRIVDYLRDKKILLVMDNFEHVLDGAAIVQELLRAAPQVQVLVTSRLKLNLMGETIFHIEGLSVAENNLERNSAVQLFVQSARQTRLTFELNKSGLPAVTRICRMVGGMPLAIVLAAAWIDTLTVDEIAVEIEKSLDMLETEKRDVPDRQRSVRAVIESSWNQVEDSTQDLLKRLSVFRGGFTRHAAQEAAGASLRGLSQLVDKALVRREPKKGRYSIHELVRQFAEEQLRLSTDEEQSAHENHAKYFADLMKTHWAHIRERGQKTALMEIEADIDNIRVAWNYWADHQDASHLEEFVGALWVFFETRGSFTPAIRFFEEAAKKLVASEPAVVCARAELRARQAWFTALIGLPDQGLRLAQESVNVLKQYNRDVSVNTLDSVNINAIFLNQKEIVLQISQEMMARANRSGDIWEHGWALIWSAYTFVLQRQIGEALQAGQQALVIFEKLENPFGVSVASGLILGITSMATGDMHVAKDYFLRGMHASEEINYLRLLQIIYDNLGTLALMENEIERAQEFFLKSLRISQEAGQTREMLASLRDLASVYIAQGNIDTALQFLAVVLNHPASDQNSLNRPERLRDEAEKLRTQIQNQLDQAVYASAWETGQRLRLTDLVAQILN